MLIYTVRLSEACSIGNVSYNLLNSLLDCSVAMRITRAIYTEAPKRGTRYYKLSYSFVFLVHLPFVHIYIYYSAENYSVSVIYRNGIVDDPSIQISRFVCFHVRAACHLLCCVFASCLLKCSTTHILFLL